MAKVKTAQTAPAKELAPEPEALEPQVAPAEAAPVEAEDKAAQEEVAPEEEVKEEEIAVPAGVRDILKAFNQAPGMYFDCNGRYVSSDADPATLASATYYKNPYYEQ